MSARHVLLTTEGTYPFSAGGVSTWCHTLIRSTPEVRYTLLPLMMNPHVRLHDTPPPNVHRMLRVPLWGIEEPSEFVTDVPFARLYDRARNTSTAAIESEFLPLFRRFLATILTREPDAEALGHRLVEMEDYFRRRDYTRTFKSRAVWDAFVEIVEEHGRTIGVPPTLFDLTECLRWLFHFLIVLNVRVPRVSVTHATAAAFCGIPCITTKIRHRTPFILTEHGVYLREQNLFFSTFRHLLFAKHFLLSLITAVVRTNYHFADVVAPVCRYNTRWEVAQGTSSEKIHVIYNGVDPDRFSPGAREDGPLHVVATARIHPLKDIETFLRAAKKIGGDVRFSIFGAVSDESYYRACLALRRELGVDVSMGEATSDVVAAYRSADVVLLTSISEAFPFSVIEAMSCGKAVVASDVGGVREALEGCGVVVRPRDVDAFATEVRRLLDDAPLRASLGTRARAKVLEQFRIDQSVASYRRLYHDPGPTAATPVSRIG
jgi:polysaccharide biosynthesis protein PelF